MIPISRIEQAATLIKNTLSLFAYMAVRILPVRHGTTISQLVAVRKYSVLVMSVADVKLRLPWTPVKHSRIFVVYLDGNLDQPMSISSRPNKRTSYVVRESAQCPSRQKLVL